MAQQFVISTGAVALTAATAKTVMEIATASTQDAVFIGFDVTFDGSGSGNNCKVELTSFAATGTGTAATVNFYGQNRNKAAAITTGKVNDSVEPASQTALFGWYVPLNSGFSYVWPSGREYNQINSQFRGFRLTSPAAVNAIVNFIFEE